jgi:hypothetical protein
MYTFALWITLPVYTNKITNSSKMPQFKYKKYVNSRILKHRFFRLGLGIAIGALTGLLYWKFVGCHSGTCPLTSNPYKTVIMFSLMGGLLTYNKEAGKDAVK